MSDLIMRRDLREALPPSCRLLTLLTEKGKKSNLNGEMWVVTMASAGEVRRENSRAPGGVGVGGWDGSAKEGE